MRAVAYLRLHHFKGSAMTDETALPAPQTVTIIDVMRERAR